MEMHQVRYFLAVARTLHFTRAAEECNVTQPSLTRAIQQLEDELGGDLFRRERPHAQMTELGQRMLPLLQQCYDTALGARSLASSIKSGEVGALRLALSRTIDLSLLVPHLPAEQAFERLELKFLRGNADRDCRIPQARRRGTRHCGAIGEEWDRLDSWPLFTEGFLVAITEKHRLANRDASTSTTCERSTCSCGPIARTASASRMCCAAGTSMSPRARNHLRARPRAFLEAKLGIAVIPRSVCAPPAICGRRSMGSNCAGRSICTVLPDASAPRSHPRN